MCVCVCDSDNYDGVDDDNYDDYEGGDVDSGNYDESNTNYDSYNDGVMMVRIMIVIMTKTMMIMLQLLFSP